MCLDDIIEGRNSVVHLLTPTHNDFPVIFDSITATAFRIGLCTAFGEKSNELCAAFTKTQECEVVVKHDLGCEADNEAVDATNAFNQLNRPAM